MSSNARKTKKGGSAWQYTQSVYGSGAEQHAANPSLNNEIAANFGTAAALKGGDAWQHAEAVYGRGDSQSAVAGRGNEIATKVGGGKNKTRNAKNTRKARKARRTRKSRVGGTVVADVAVPVVLVAASHVYKRGAASKLMRRIKKALSGGNPSASGSNTDAAPIAGVDLNALVRTQANLAEQHAAYVATASPTNIADPGAAKTVNVDAPPSTK